MFTIVSPLIQNNCRIWTLFGLLVDFRLSPRTVSSGLNRCSIGKPAGSHWLGQSFAQPWPQPGTFKRRGLFKSAWDTASRSSLHAYRGATHHQITLHERQNIILGRQISFGVKKSKHKSGVRHMTRTSNRPHVSMRTEGTHKAR